MRRVPFGRLFWAVSLCGILAAIGRADDPEPTAEPLARPREILTDVQSVRSLTTSLAAMAFPVWIEGVVLFANPNTADLFIYDGVAGIYVTPSSKNAAVKSGDRIRLHGTTSEGSFSPCIIPTTLDSIGRGDYPPGRPYDLGKEDSAREDAQWIISSGLVGRVNVIRDETRVEVIAPRGFATLVIPTSTVAPQLEQWRGQKVTFRGVCVPGFDANRKVVGWPRIFVPSLEFIRREEDAKPASRFPLRAISELQGHTSDLTGDPRQARVRGQITVIVPAGTGMIQVQDGTGTISVFGPSLTSNTQQFALYDEVDVAGTVGYIGETLAITKAEVTRLGRGPRVIPRRMTLEEFSPDTPPGTYLEFESTFVDHHTRMGRPAIVIGDGRLRVDCVSFDPGFSERVGDWKPGSRVRVGGLLAPPRMSGIDLDPTPAFVVPSLSDLTLLASPEPPSWWTGERLAIGLGGVVLLVVAGVAWSASLRRRVRAALQEKQTVFERQEQLEGQLRQAQKMEAVGRLAGGIAHDFNNLLTVINGCAELLRGSLPEKSPQADLINDIAQAGEKAAGLTSQLLIFSKHRALPLAPLDLNETLGEAVRLLRRVIGEHIEVETRFAVGLSPVLAEAGMLHQVLLNLAVNARDAMPRGGRLRISTEAIWEEGAGWVRLSVGDNGLGMDAETRSRVFEPFFTTKPVGQGTGLGLATVYGLVQGLGGRIKFDSEPGVGTRFDIDLPPTEQTVIDVPASGAQYPVARQESQVLVVEDDPSVQRFVQRALEQAGFRVLMAAGPAEALRLLEADAPTVHLMVTDMVMPEMTGKQLAERVVRLYPDLPVLFISGYSPEELRMQGLHFEDWPFLQKPFTPNALAAKVKEMLADSAQRLPGLPSGG